MQSVITTDKRMDQRQDQVILFDYQCQQLLDCKIIKGTKNSGRAVIMCQPRNPHYSPGTVLTYMKGNATTYPVVCKKIDFFPKVFTQFVRGMRGAMNAHALTMAQMVELAFVKPEPKRHMRFNFDKGQLISAQI